MGAAWCGTSWCADASRMVWPPPDDLMQGGGPGRVTRCFARPARPRRYLARKVARHARRVLPLQKAAGGIWDAQKTAGALAGYRAYWRKPGGVAWQGSTAPRYRQRHWPHAEQQNIVKCRSGRGVAQGVSHVLGFARPRRRLLSPSVLREDSLGQARACGSCVATHEVETPKRTAATI